MTYVGLDSPGVLLHDHCRRGRGVAFGSFRKLANQLNDHLVGWPFFWILPLTRY